MLLVERDHPVGPGTQKIYRFDNGYGASVIRFHVQTGHMLIGGSYGAEQGLWELGVLKFKSSDPTVDDGELCYDTPITSDVLGFLTDEDVEVYLKMIEQLPRMLEITDGSVTTTDTL